MRGLESFVGSSANPHVTSSHGRKHASRDDDDASDDANAFAAHLQSAKSATKDADAKKDASDPAPLVDPRALALAIPVDGKPVEPQTKLSLDATLAGQMTKGSPEAAAPVLPISGGASSAPAPATDAAKADEGVDATLGAAVEDASAPARGAASPGATPSASHGKGGAAAASAPSLPTAGQKNIVRAGDLAAMSAAPAANASATSASSATAAAAAKPAAGHASSAQSTSGVASAQAAPADTNANAGGNSGGDRGAGAGNGAGNGSKSSSNVKAEALKADAAKSDAMKSELAAATTSLTDSVASEALTSAMRDNGLTTAKPLAQTANNASAATSADAATAAANSATTADRAAAAASATNQLVLRHATSGEIDHPELGRIAVNAEMKDGRVEARISADRAESAAVLTPHAVHMASDVRAADIPLSRLHVDDGAASRASSGSSSSSAGENGSSRGSSRDGGSNGDRSGSSRGTDTGVQTSVGSNSGSGARVRIVL